MSGHIEKISKGRKDTASKNNHSRLLDSLFNLYLDYARIVRFWFVAYGIGGPALILTNQPVLNLIKQWEIHLRTDWNVSFVAAMLFLSGAVMQVLIAMLNKWAAWYKYFAVGGCRRRETKKSLLYQWSVWFSNEFITDIIADTLSLFFFGIATGLLMWCATH